ncbi:MAG: enoyl-CoA hydratase [Quisquiliibacterium sp.]
MSEASIQVSLRELDGGRVADVIIDNSRRLNSLNGALMEQFVARFAELSADESLRAVVLTGAGGKAFVGGADIDEMAGLDAGGARRFITRVHSCCAAVRDCPVPVIARIAGHVYGAGLELAASCDLRVATEGSRFGMPEVRLGIPSVVEAAVLPSLVGWGRTRQMLYLGDTFDAAQALAWGMVEEVASDAQIDAVLDRWLESLLACGPQSIRLQKKLIRRWEDLPLRDAVAAGIDTFAQAYETDEPAEMMRRFRQEHRARKTGHG